MLRYAGVCCLLHMSRSALNCLLMLILLARKLTWFIVAYPRSRLCGWTSSRSFWYVAPSPSYTFSIKELLALLKATEAIPGTAWQLADAYSFRDYVCAKTKFRELSSPRMLLRP